uniref:Uncharacterized protein n=1 Tax=Anguilla anguilla TaxID=7936 RepID=A0A0E9QX73_ANGAN
MGWSAVGLGSKLISFIMLERRTGSSCLRKAKEVLSQAFVEPEKGFNHDLQPWHQQQACIMASVMHKGLLSTKEFGCLKQ